LSAASSTSLKIFNRAVSVLW